MSASSTRIAGLAAAAGVALGRWATIAPTALPAPTRIGAGDAQHEIARLHEAARSVSKELRELSAQVAVSGHEAEAGIFRAQATVARDPDLLDAAAAEIERANVDAVTAVRVAAKLIAERIGALEDELLRARATDVIDVGDRIARQLAGIATMPSLLVDGPAIIVADDLAPSITATLPRDLVLGIALERSSPAAHASILARAYGIPAVVGATGLLQAVQAAGVGSEIAIDGSSGEVVIAPDADERARFEDRAAREAQARLRDQDEASLPAITTDGITVSLMANIGNPGESVRAVDLGAEGVGLFRTEFLFLERSTAPSEDEQTEAYRRAVEAFSGQAVIVRLLDVGGDKPIPYLPMDREDNPFLGVRSLRLVDRYAGLFVTQLRACLRAATSGPVRVMAPMVADAADVETLVRLRDRARSELAAAGVPMGEVELGVMLEIPSAVLTLDAYADRITFASLGTNDLLQYLFAADRGNRALERYQDPMHPAHLRLIREAVTVADRCRIPLSVCGEMAGDPIGALSLVGLGIRALSMGASNLPAVRRAIRASSAKELAYRVAKACDAISATEAREALAPRVAAASSGARP